MINTQNFQKLLEYLGFSKKNNTFIKQIGIDTLQVDFEKQKIVYPSKIIINDKTTCNFSATENFVVFECVHRLLEQGYHPEHIELEKRWQLGHSQKSGKADICVKDNDNNIILIIECKTSGIEYNKAKDILETDSRNQLFSYLQQATSTQFLSLYTSDFTDNRMVSDYYLISVTDNEELLKNNPTLNSYKETSTSEEKWQVWKDTYDQEYATIGLFENNKPYEIGKTVFSIYDLKTISNKDIQGKYHEFATILRQHNVSGRENAFDKLVNLFLCKITDETQNKEHLKFYWKGKAFDNPFDFQDRLQELYKIGMEKFLNDKITYIANHQIEDAFGIFKDKPNIAKDTIKEYFKELKFFANNDFAFIDVHNEKLFYQNFAVLLKVAQMIQDIRLSDSEENQFLGDMFEGFLDAGVKQSEGQFFTPMPIVKFIINSLPYKEKPKVIDYACGAGHFLNEYFTQNKSSEIIGIEKEYRLSKVAKVSSFMYGSNMKIIYNDALAHNDKIEENTFDVLIANPPYSVKGFLSTLNQEERERYELSNFVSDISKTNAIECFFIERAKQLLKKGGIAGIIVPSSILNKDTPNLYTKTREILLEHFNIIAIAEFGSGTFGKTSTNTVTLFLERKDPSKKIHIHYKNMIDTWFSGDLSTNNALKDEHFLESYCSYCDINRSDYNKFLQNKLNDNLLKTEKFSEYQKAFEKLYKAPTTKAFKAKNEEEKEWYKKQNFLQYLKEKESEKLYFYCLAHSQKNEVVIIKSPSDNKEIKKFLGYEWSNRKGDEGIKYIANVNFEIDEDLESDDKRILENQQGLKYISTPLYNPNNSDDENKINKIIKDNFNGIKTPIKDDLKTFVSQASLKDMLDFDNVEFCKKFLLEHKNKIEIDTQWPLERFKNTLNKIKGNITKISKSDILSKGKFPVITQEKENFISGYSNNQKTINDLPIILFGDHSCVFKFIDFEFIRGADGTVLLKPDERFNPKYYYYFLEVFNTKLIRNIDKYERHKKYLNDIKIPIPDLNIQQKIAEECSKIDDEYNSTRMAIEDYKQKIEDIFNGIGDIRLISEGG